MRLEFQMQCTECKHKNYNSTKNKDKNTGRMELKKYCKKCRKHTVHREVK